MADKKITELTELTSVTSTDMIPIVDDPGGSPITKKATVANIVALKVLNRAYTWYLEGTAIDGVAGAVYIAPQAMTVTQTQAVLTSGTCTATLKAGSTTINAISCSDSLATDTSITAPTIAAGDILTLTISSASSPVGLKVTMECTQP